MEITQTAKNILFCKCYRQRITLCIDKGVWVCMCACCIHKGVCVCLSVSLSLSVPPLLPSHPPHTLPFFIFLVKTLSTNQTVVDPGHWRPFPLTELPLTTSLSQTPLRTRRRVGRECQGKRQGYIFMRSSEEVNEGTKSLSCGDWCNHIIIFCSSTNHGYLRNMRMISAI